MSPALAFFRDEVDPAVRMFLRDYGCVWKARCAAMMLSHTADHVWWDKPASQTPPKRARDEARDDMTLDKYRADVSRRWPDFAVLSDVSNASKHARLTSMPKDRGLWVSEAGQVAAHAMFVPAAWDDTQKDIRQGVFIPTGDGKLMSLCATVIEVHRLWSAHFGLPIESIELRPSV